MYISTGESVTVDAENLAKKLDAALGKVERTLSKAQKAAGLQIDASGRLINAQGKLVEGLTLTQTKMGQYVDEIGKIHTANGEFVGDLNKIEQSLGFYSDALGNVYNAQGEFIRLTNDAKKAMADQAKAQQEAARQTVITSQLTRKAFSDSFRGLAGAAQQANALFDTFEKAGLVSSELSKSLQGVAKGLSIAAQTFQGITDLASGISTAAKTANDLFSGIASSAATASKEVATLGGSAASLAPALSALGGPAGLAVAGVAAFGVGAAAIYAATRPSVELSENFKQIEANARKAGDSIRTMGDALHYGAFSLPLTEYESALKKTEETSKKVLDEWKKYQQDLKNSEELLRTGDMAAATAGASITGYENAKRDQENAWAEYNAVVAKMIEAAREEQKTEVDRLSEQKKAFEKIREQAEQDDKLRNDTEARAIIERQLSIIDDKIAEAKEREAEAATQAARDAQERARKNAGIDRFSTPQQKEIELTLDAYRKAVDDWTTRAAEFGMSQEQVDEALKRYREAVEAAQKSAIESRFGIKLGATAEGNSIDDGLSELKKGLDESVLTLEEYNAGIRQLQDKRSKELDSLSDSLKTADSIEAAEKARLDALSKLSDEISKGYINQQQNDALSDKIEKEYLATVDKLNQQKKAQLEREARVSFSASAPLVEYEDRVKALSTALSEGLIQQDEFNAALDQINRETLAASPRISKLGGAIAKAETAQEAHAATLKEIDDALRKGILSEEKALDLRNKANAQLEERQRQENAQARSALGVDAFIVAGEKEKTAREKVVESYQKLKEAADKNLLSDEEFRKVKTSYKNQLEKIAAEEKQGRDEEKRRNRESQRSALGIDSLLEELKSPLEKYRETMDAVTTALKSGAINAAESVALENKAAEEYWKAIASNTDAVQKTSSTLSKFEATKSMSSGSEALYLAQVRTNTANYQSRIQSTTAALLNNSDESVYRQRESIELLSTVVESLNGIGVYTG